MGKAKLTQAAAGARIAEIIGKESAYAHTSIQRYLSGEQVSTDITDGFVEMMGVPPPIIIAETPEEAEWCSLGRQLAVERPDLFAAILEQARALVRGAHKTD